MSDEPTFSISYWNYCQSIVAAKSFVFVRHIVRSFANNTTEGRIQKTPSIRRYQVGKKGMINLDNIFVESRADGSSTRMGILRNTLA